MVFAFNQEHDQVSLAFAFLTVINVRVWRHCLGQLKEVSQEKWVALTILENDKDLHVPKVKLEFSKKGFNMLALGPGMIFQII